MKYIGLADELFSAFMGPTKLVESFFDENPPKDLEDAFISPGIDAVAFNVEEPTRYKELKKDSTGYRTIRECHFVAK